MEVQPVHIPDNAHYQELKQFIEANRNVPGPLIQVLHRAQKIFGYLPLEVQHFVARELNVPLAKVFGVITFYNFFRLDPIGDHVINLCLGTACHVKGASDIIKVMEKELGIKVGGTTADRFYTLSTARCFGACGLAPVMMLDEEVHGRLNPQKTIKILRDLKAEAAGPGQTDKQGEKMKLEDLKKIREKTEKDMLLRAGKTRLQVVVGMGTSGIAAGARETLKVLLEEVEKRNLRDVIVRQAGERGLSSHEPIVTVMEEGKPSVVYGNVSGETARKIVAEHLVNGNPLSESIIEVKE